MAEERPDLEEAKNQLIVSNAKMKQELKEIEDRILYRLSSSEGSPVDDIDLIETLEASKIKSQEISVSFRLERSIWLQREKKEGGGGERDRETTRKNETNRVGLMER